MNMCNKVLICIISLLNAVRCDIFKNGINDIRNTKLASGRYKGWTAISTSTNRDENTKRRSWYEDTSFPSLPEQQINQIEQSSFPNSEYQPNNFPTTFDDSTLVQNEIGDNPAANNYDLPISDEFLNTNEVKPSNSGASHDSNHIINQYTYATENPIPSKYSQTSSALQKLEFSSLDSRNKQNSDFKPSNPIRNGFSYQTGTFTPFNHEQINSQENYLYAKPEYQIPFDKPSAFIESTFTNPRYQFLNYPKIPDKIIHNKIKISQGNEIKLPTSDSQTWNHQRLIPFSSSKITTNSDVGYYDFPPFNTQSQIEASSKIPNTQFSIPSNPTSDLKFIATKFPQPNLYMRVSPVSKFITPWTSTASKQNIKLPVDNEEWLKSFGWTISNTIPQDYKPKLTPNKKEFWFSNGWNDYASQKRYRPNVKYVIIKSVPRNEKLNGFARRSSSNMLHRSFWR